MPDNHNICLLGFSPESETRIKKLINSAPQGSSIVWVAANHKGLNGVVINASFLPTPQIQKYISLVRCPIVCAYNNDDGAAQAKQYHFPALICVIPTMATPFRGWINSLVATAHLQRRLRLQRRHRPTTAPRMLCQAAIHANYSIISAAAITWLSAPRTSAILPGSSRVKGWCTSTTRAKPYPVLILGLGSRLTMTIFPTMHANCNSTCGSLKAYGNRIWTAARTLTIRPITA
ncbi:hypothetical protein HMPREF9080_01031 [Cardiobacterium valvarum F0432]|uniref:Uncharacterized protein n=1 Tax=Cardiobacterium valvarum F0432 TaxID=797473 RepID=G9ZE47_9GAMM|nr:hypothetical protein HMPREF9080_01031 [Cardiobacterium valvarum F0432]